MSLLAQFSHFMCHLFTVSVLQFITFLFSFIFTKLSQTITVCDILPLVKHYMKFVITIRAETWLFTSFHFYLVWNDVNVCSSDQSLLEESTVGICKNFVVNNCQTGNFGSLVRVFLTRSAELKTSVQCQEWVYWLIVSVAHCMQLSFNWRPPF